MPRSIRLCTCRRTRAPIVAGCLFTLVLAGPGCSDESMVMPSSIGLPLAGTQPNIVVIMADDMDVDGMNTMFQLGLAPNIQQLAQAGAVFNQSFVSNALCCPSRATFLTGQYSHNNGVLSNRGDDGGVDELNDTSTIGTWMRAAGYRTAYIGKYLNGYGSDPKALAPSFHPRYVPPGWDHWEGQLGGAMFNYKINDTVDGVTRIVSYGEGYQEYKTTVLADRAADFIREAETRNDDQPFFMVVMPKAPHPEANKEPLSRWDQHVRPDPMDATEKADQMALIASLTPTSFDKPSFDYVDRSQPTWLRFVGGLPMTDDHKAQVTSYYHDRLGSMLAVDDLVGTVMATLVENGELDNTIVIFTSDNGYVLGEHRWHTKIVAFDESVRVPLYIRGPGIAPGAIENLVLNADLAPTITELAGTAPGLPSDGTSLVGLLTTGTAAPWRTMMFLEHFMVDIARPPDYAGLRTGQYKFVEYYDGSGERELYDLAFDPFETVSLDRDPDQASRVAAYSAHLADLRQCKNGSCQELEAQTLP